MGNCRCPSCTCFIAGYVERSLFQTISGTTPQVFLCYIDNWGIPAQFILIRFQHWLPLCSSLSSFSSCLHLHPPQTPPGSTYHFLYCLYLQFPASTFLHHPSAIRTSSIFPSSFTSPWSIHQFLTGFCLNPPLFVLATLLLHSWYWCRVLTWNNNNAIPHPHPDPYRYCPSHRLPPAHSLLPQIPATATSGVCSKNVQA